MREIRRRRLALFFEFNQQTREHWARVRASGRFTVRELRAIRLAQRSFERRYVSGIYLLFSWAAFILVILSIGLLIEWEEMDTTTYLLFLTFVGTWICGFFVLIGISAVALFASVLLLLLAAYSRPFLTGQFYQHSTTIVAVMFTLVAGVLWIVFTYVPRVKAEEKLISHATAIFSLVANTPWNVEVKRELLVEMEELAATFESRLPIVVTKADPKFRRYAVEQGRRTAAAIRNLKHWAYTPQQGTKLSLEGSVEQILRALISGEWHYLPCASPESDRDRFLRSTLRTVSLLTRSSVPVTIVILGHRLFPHAVPDSLLITSLVVGLIYFLVTVDPGAKDRFTTAVTVWKDIKGADKVQ